MNIVSLLPSATEIVCALGLRERLVAVTHECDYPPDVAALPKATRTRVPADAPSRVIDELVRAQMRGRQALYSLNLDVLQRVRPDLIVTQALCDVCAVAEAEVTDAACTLPGQPRVLNLEPMTLDQVLDGMRAVGEAAGCPERARDVVAGYRRRIDG
ncbi:MAG: cobalamin-binding protein, partial [Phycisphaerae bacterium]